MSMQSNVPTAASKFAASQKSRRACKTGVKPGVALSVGVSPYVCRNFVITIASPRAVERANCSGHVVFVSDAPDAG